jgi:hypothetical protein
MAKSVLSGCFVTCAQHIAPLVFKYVLQPGMQVSQADYQAYASPIAYHTLVVLLPNMNDEQLKGFSFEEFTLSTSTSASASASAAASAASPGANRSSRVHRSNVRSYIKAKMQYDLIDCRRAQLDALREGLCSIAPMENVFQLCGGELLQMLVSGPTSLTAEDICRLLIYNPSDSPSRASFEAWLHTLDRAMLTKFLLFVTGLPQLPLHNPRIVIMRVPFHGAPQSAPLPVAHTCFRQCDLPQYGDDAVMQAKLVQAMELSDGGFHIA